MIKSLLILLAMLAFIFLPPALHDLSYKEALADWIKVAFFGFTSALVIGSLLGLAHSKGNL